MNTKHFLFLAYLFFSTLVFGQEIDTKKLDLYFSTLAQNNKFMGSVAVSQAGKVIYTNSIGFSDVEKQIKATETSTYRIGSISKTFTAVLILKAIEDRKITLDQPIKKYFPHIQNADQITILQLLQHRSGIADFTELDNYTDWNTQAKSESEMVSLIAKGGSDFMPDTQTSYSNSNYVLLSFILENIYQASYSDLLSKYITHPLSLKNTYLGHKINTANNEAKSYTFDKNWIVAPETDISIPLGSGGIVSNPTDLVAFSDALFQGKIIKKESLDLMKTMKNNYGLGLMVTPFYDKISYGHRGGIDKFTSVFSYFPKENISFALTSNGSNYNSNEIPITVLNAVFNQPFEIPNFSTYQVDSSMLDQYIGVYSSNQVPIKLTITKSGHTLIVQATGQAANELEPSEKDTFKLEKAGIVLSFDPQEKTMVLKQGGGEFTFTKE
jgi:D-alanyl-D-alanine carboxypeptidase